MLGRLGGGGLRIVLWNLARGELLSDLDSASLGSSSRRR